MAVTEMGWVDIMYNYWDQFDNMLDSTFFFLSFNLLVRYVLLSLLTGLIWEIFSIISSAYQVKQNTKKETTPGNVKNKTGSQNKSDEGSGSLDDSLNSSKEELDPYRLAFYRDDNLEFFRNKANEIRKDKAVIPVEMKRDDYSFEDDANPEVKSTNSRNKELLLPL